MTAHHDRILIDSLEIDCVVGIRPAERLRKQRVRVHLDLALDLSRAGRSGKIAHTVDYSRVASEVTALLQFRAYKLIEVATEELAASLLGLHPAVERACVRVEKPEALRGRARSAAVEITRSRESFPIQRSHMPSGEVNVLLDSEEAKISLVRIAPGTVFEREGGRLRRLEWLSTGRLLDGEHELSLHQARVRDDGSNTRFENPAEEDALLFCCETTLMFDLRP